jgi:signal transduction histidine kinase
MTILAELGFSKKIIEYVELEASLCVLVLDAHGTIEAANKYSRKILGETIIGSMFSSHIVDFNNTFNFDILLTQPDKTHLVHFSIAAGLPQTYYFRFSLVDGKILAIGQQDAEEGERLQTSLLDLNRELNNMTRQLNKKNAALEKLDAQKNQFFGMAAHDLRHPLSVITLFSSFLVTEAQDALSKEHNEFIVNIHEAAASMEHILNDFLDFSVIESGHLVLQLERTDINTWLQQAIRGQALLAKQQQVSLTLLFSFKKKCVVQFDPQKMAQVINNLLSNAIKFSPADGKITIKVDTTPEEVIISVTDQGPGIAAKDHERIFSPFERIEVPGSKSPKGSGVGLVLVKKIIDAHQGRIWLESEPGKGATFFIALPLDRR